MARQPRKDEMESARIRLTMRTDHGGAITLVGTPRGIEAAVARLGSQGWHVADDELEPSGPGRFSVAPAPLGCAVAVAGRSVA